MRMNNRGQTGLEIPVGAFVVMGIMAAITSLGLYKTATNGVLVNNMKVIGCKIANGGEKECNKKYAYESQVDEIAKSGGGLRHRILEAQK